MAGEGISPQLRQPVRYLNQVDDDLAGIVIKRVAQLVRDRVPLHSPWAPSRHDDQPGRDALAFILNVQPVHTFGQGAESNREAETLSQIHQVRDRLLT